MASTCIGCQMHKRTSYRYSLPRGASSSFEIRTSISTSSWTSPVTGVLCTDTRRHRSRKSQVWKRSTVRFQPNSPRDLMNSFPQTVVYSTSSPLSDRFPSIDLWHSDVSYELQPPSTTSLKLLTGPEAGGDTLWSSGYALYSSLSPGLQVYLEGLTALHSAVAQADGARAAGIPVRREPIETVHPVIRVHPATGWKSVYVNPGFTRRIVGVPKAESDAILAFLFAQISQNHDFQVRFKWEPNDVAIWDNRVVTHSATFDFWPATRHALRATPHGERPISVPDYERTTGKRARDRQLELWGRLRIVPFERKDPIGYED